MEVDDSRVWRPRPFVGRSAAARSPTGGGSDRIGRRAAIPGPLEAAHRTFVVVGLVVLIADLIILTVSPRPSTGVWLEALAIAALIATGLVWYRGVRRGRYGGIDRAVDAATIFLAAFSATSIPLTAGSGVMMVRASLDSLSGSLRAKLAHSAVGYACLAAGLLLADRPSKVVGDGLILSGVALFVVTLLFHAFAIRLAEGERALRHELVLAAASGQLAGRADERRIAEVVLAAAEDLAGQEVPAAVAVGTADRLVVTAATKDLGQAVGAFVRLDGDRLQPSHPDRPAAVPAPHLPDRLWTAAVTLPMPAQGTTHGVLIVATRPLDPALRGSLESLCSSAGPALATARLTDELETLAFHDLLTRLPNRAQLDEHTDAALARAARDGSTVGLLVLDLDGFKQVNDRFGHRAGDEALVISAARLRDAIRQGDVAARLGGDEFAVLLPSLGDAEEAGAVARRVVETLGRPLPIEKVEVLVGVSVGVVTWSPASRRAGGSARTPTPGALLHDADRAMYRAKSRGVGYHVAVSGG